jgi:hypothetical protein
LYSRRETPHPALRATFSHKGRRKRARGETDSIKTHVALDDPLLAQAFGFIRLDPAQGFKQRVGVLAQQRRTADRDG